MYMLGETQALSFLKLFPESHRKSTFKHTAYIIAKAITVISPQLYML